MEDKSQEKNLGKHWCQTMLRDPEGESLSSGCRGYMGRDHPFHARELLMRIHEPQNLILCIVQRYFDIWALRISSIVRNAKY